MISFFRQQTDLSVGLLSVVFQGIESHKGGVHDSKHVVCSA